MPILELRMEIPILLQAVEFLHSDIFRIDFSSKALSKLDNSGHTCHNIEEMMEIRFRECGPRDVEPLFFAEICCLAGG